MATTLKSDQLVIARFIRRAELPRISITTWRDGMADNLIALKSADWKEAAYTTEQTQHPTNDPTLEDYSAEIYDAFKQAASAKNNTMTQFAGMAAYRIALPAAGGNVQTVKLRAGTDKFCVGGLKIAAILSNSEAPPTGWEILRAGGTDEAIDTTGVCATLGEIDAESGAEIKGILDGTTETGKTSVAMVGDVTFTLPEQSTNYQYLYLVITLLDYTSYRLPNREYWVEGSGILSAESLEITFAEDFELPPGEVDYDVVLPLLYADMSNDTVSPGDAHVEKYFYNSIYQNGTDLYLVRKELLLGLIAGGDVMPRPGTIQISETSPLKHCIPVYLRSMRNEKNASGSPLSDREILKGGWCGPIPVSSKAIAGYTMWVKSIGASVGLSPIRVSLLNHDERTLYQDTQDAIHSDITAVFWQATPGLWDGTHKDILGTATFRDVQDGQVLGIPITKTPTKPYLFILAMLGDVNPNDTNLARIGYQTNTQGISVINAHISKIYYPGS